MAKAYENLAHVRDRVASAFNTLNKIVEREEGTSTTTLKERERELEALQEDVQKKMKQNPKSQYGSFPETTTITRTVAGTEYTTERYFYDEEHPTGITERYILDRMNTLKDYLAETEAAPKKKSDLPDFIKDHAEKLGDLLREMDDLAQTDTDHPYNMKRTRTTLTITAN